MKNKKYKELPQEGEKKDRPEACDYQGAEWTGGDLISSEFGRLEKGKIYPLKEETARNSAGWKPIYK